MNPETHAARDRLLGLLSANGGAPVIDEAVDGDLRTVLAALDDELGVVTDSMGYVTIGEDPAATHMRGEVERLAGQLNEALRERDLWAARTRKLLGERSGRLTLEALDAAAG